MFFSLSSTVKATVRKETAKAEAGRRLKQLFSAALICVSGLGSQGPSLQSLESRQVRVLPARARVQELWSLTEVLGD